MGRKTGSPGRVVRCDTGATAIEYSLLAGMVALVIIAAVASVGPGLAAIIQVLAETL